MFTVATSPNGPAPLVARSIRKLVSSAELSIQVTRIAEAESAVATAPYGSDGGFQGSSWVVALAVLDQGETSAAVFARTL